MSKSNDKKAPGLRVVTEPVGRVTCKIMEHSHVSALRWLQKYRFKRIKRQNIRRKGVAPSISRDTIENLSVKESD